MARSRESYASMIMIYFDMRGTANIRVERRRGEEGEGGEMGWKAEEKNIYIKDDGKKRRRV